MIRPPRTVAIVTSAARISATAKAPANACISGRPEKISTKFRTISVRNAVNGKLVRIGIVGLSGAVAFCGRSGDSTPSIETDARGAAT